MFFVDLVDVDDIKCLVHDSWRTASVEEKALWKARATSEIEEAHGCSVNRHKACSPPRPLVSLDQPHQGLVAHPAEKCTAKAVKPPSLAGKKRGSELSVQPQTLLAEGNHASIKCANKKLKPARGSHKRPGESDGADIADTIAWHDPRKTTLDRVGE